MATQSNVYESARKSLDELLGNLTFLKVICVQKEKNSYTGEAVEIINGQQKRVAFFDKFGRSRNFLQVGPITLTQAAYGYDHVSSVPTMGEVLVGILVENTRKSHLKYVLRGWSSDAKPLQELARIVRYGTKRSEFELRDLLCQPAGLLVKNGTHAEYRDEIYMLARVVLFGNLRPLQVLATTENPGYKLKREATEVEIQAAKNLKLSEYAKDFIDLITVKLQCQSIQEDFLDGFLETPPLEPPGPTTTGPLVHQSQVSYYSATQQTHVAYDPQQTNVVQYMPSSPVYMPGQTNIVPTSPVYHPGQINVPTSPVYHPGQTNVPSSPVYMPTSPTYNE